MKTHNYIIATLCLMVWQCTGVLVAQDNMSDAYDIGIKSYSFTYTDTQNTEYYSDDFDQRGQYTNDVFYKFTLSRNMDIAIEHCGSELNDTYVYLLDEWGNVIESCDDASYCSNSLHSYLSITDLAAGTYYVVSEGYGGNGYISTTITGYSAFTPVNSSFSNPIQAGTFASDFTYTNTQNTSNYLNNYEGRLSNDVFYKFTITSPMSVTIDHCGSEVSDTYLYLFNESSQLIYSNDDDGMYMYCQNYMNSFIYMPDLPAGTYYVVSEGFSDNGNITTTIKSVKSLDKNSSNWLNPIDAGVKTTSFEYVDTKNTTNYSNAYIGQFTKDVFYKFTLNQAMDITVSHCGSELGDTYLHLLNANGDKIASNNDYTGDGKCSNSLHACIKMNLNPGIYYAVTEGKNSNGNITTTIKGVIPLDKTSSNWLNPIDIGKKDYTFEYTDTKNTTNFPNAYNGQLSSDVFYRFELSKPMDIIISHCGSALSDTYLHLLNESGERIEFNNDYSGTDKCTNTLHSYIKRTNLDIGIYYVVSEGFGNSNGNITTSIKGVCPLPATGLYDGSAVTSPANAGTNYILSITPTVATSDVSGLGVNESVQTVQYFDGLGRPIQTVQRGITPTKQDLATLTEYDGASREWKQWLPITSTGSGAIVPTTNFTSISSLYSTEGRPYTEAIIEPSPLNRVLGNKGPGSAWETKPTSIAYETNTSTDAVACFSVNASNNLVRDANNYTQGSLYKTIAKDEDNKTVEEFKDKLGQVVLKRSKNGAENVDTYFVYNDLGQLAYVIPPLAADGLTTAGIINDDNDLLKKYGYLYKYDERGNCKEKRLPGCEPIYMVYDKADRLVLSQDGNQREKTTKEWTVTKYDVLGRVIFTGVTTQFSGSSHADLLASYKTDLVVETFANGAYSNSKFTNATPLTVNYYDNYSFISSLPANKQFVGYQLKTGYDKAYPASAASSAELNAKGLLTGTRTYYLDGSGDFSAAALYYDTRGQVVQTRSTNHLGGTDISYNEYYFSGKVKRLLSEHTMNSTNSSSTTELYTYTYDHALRPLTTTYSLNGGTPVVLSDMSSNGSYDELGRLKTKKRHNGTDTESFEYNIRNWTTKITSGSFFERLYYNSDLPSGVTACYNGNIAMSVWKSLAYIYGYKYSYDNLNRLKFATATRGVGTATPTTAYGYSEDFGYDKHGNINYLQRKFLTIKTDDLRIDLNGNQITSTFDDSGTRSSYSIKEYQDKNHIEGATNEMIYDGNGNMTKDLDRNIYTIRYNILNLPEIIQFKDGHQIINAYDASGQKLSSRYYTVMMPTEVPLLSTLQPGDVLDLQYNMDIIDETGTFYVANKEYGFNGADPGVYGLNKVYNAEGYADYSWGNFVSYNYFRKDHLGNNREVWNATTNTTVQRTNYYPSGLPWAEGTGAGVQNKKYNNKEFVEMHGLDEYDSAARWYQPAIMRTTTIDPLAEKYYSISPYAWCGNNPVSRIDPDGMDWYKDKDGTYQYNPDLNKDNQKDKLGKGQSYVGETYQVKDDDGNVTTDYRKDGSIMYTNETDAYNRMWSQAHGHYKNKKEVGGVTLKNGNVLVLPDYKNAPDEFKYREYGYSIGKFKITDADKNIYSITGLIHTHQDPKAGDATPSYFTGNGYGDLGVSRQMGGVPIMTIGYDGYVHATFDANVNGRITNAPINMNGLTRTLLLKGTLLTPWLNTYPTIKKR